MNAGRIVWSMLAFSLALAALSLPLAHGAEYCRTIDGKQYCYQLPQKFENCTQGPDGKFSCPVDQEALNASCDPVEGGYACWRPFMVLDVPVEFVTPIHCFSTFQCQVNCPEEDESCHECKYMLSICVSSANLKEAGNITFTADVIKKGQANISTINKTVEYPYDLNLRLVIDPVALPDEIYNPENCNVSTEEGFTEMVCGPKTGQKFLIDAMVEKKADLVFYTGLIKEYREIGFEEKAGLLLEQLAPVLIVLAAIVVVLAAFIKHRRRRR